MRLSHSIILSALLLSSIDAQVITGTQTITLNGQTNTGDIIRGGNLTVNSSGASTISKMTMLNASTASFNINSGSLSLDLSVLNSTGAQNTVNFNVANGSTLVLTNGTAAANQTGLFSGNNTTLSVTLAQGSTLNGHLSNNANTTLNFGSNSTVNGNITQNGGSLNATLDGTIEGNLALTNAITILSANQNANPTLGASTITGSITQIGGELQGDNLKGVKLQGNFTQSGGTIKNLKFYNSELQKAINISSQASSTLSFDATSIQDVLTQNSTTAFELKNGSSMQSFTGNGGSNTINLTGSEIQSLISQTEGNLTLNSNGSSTKNIVSTTGDSLSVTLNQNSTVNGSIASNNTQNTNITSISSTITGNISQTAGSLQATLNQTRLQGNYTQVGGLLHSFSATDSTIGQGISLSNVQTNGGTQLSLTHTTITQSGIQIKNTIMHQNKNNPIPNEGINGEINNKSIINGGYEQTTTNHGAYPLTDRETVSMTFNDSTLNDGVRVRGGGGIRKDGNISTPSSHATALKFQNGSTLNGGVTANDHSIWLNFDGRSKADGGNFTATGGDFYLVASGGSTITGDLTSQDTGETRLYLSGGTFNGNVTQTNGKQHISMVLKSTLKGDIKNSNTDSVFANDEESTLQGNYTQDGGTLNMLLGGNSIITGNVLLNTVDTKLGNGTAKVHSETIKGNWTQNDGSFMGYIEGLTLEGKFTQNGGVTGETVLDANGQPALDANGKPIINDLTFSNAKFTQEIALNSPQQTNITFNDNSLLKTTTLSGSKNTNNSFTLDNNTTLEGNYILSHSTVKLSVINNSKITGNIVSNDPDNDLKLDFGGTGNEIGGDLDIKGGHLEGDLIGTTVKGSIKLEDADTHLHIVDSEVQGGIKILRGQTLMTIDHSTIGTGFSMTGVSNKGTNPTLGLSINNGTTIQGDLKFEDTTVSLGGLGDGNTITGSLITTNTTLTTGGDDFNEPNHDPALPSVSGLTIEGELKQENGSMDLILSNKSTIKGLTSFNDTQQSHLTLEDSAMDVLQANGGNNNEVTLDKGSTQAGGITLTGATTTINALDQSSITGNITSTATAPAISNTTINLDNSTLKGNINQDNGTLLMNYSNQSSMIGTLTTNSLDNLKINLDSSSITGSMSIIKTLTEVTMTNGSRIDGDLTLSANSKVTITSNASTLTGSITHTGTPNDKDTELILDFSNNSTLNNTSTTINGDMKLSASNSSINSTKGFDITLGSLDLSLSNSTGTIEHISTGGTNSVSIATTNSSNSTINLIDIRDNATLTLVGRSGAILTGDLNLKATSSTAITSLENANLKINITPEPTVKLTISLNGGIMQGIITQNQTPTGLMSLATNGQYGGRWIATGNSSIGEISIANSSGNLNNRGAMQANSFNTPISLIDTRYNVDNTSRVGLSLIGTGNPDPTQTLARTIRVGNLFGSNGVFRVYTDIGTEQSDKISAAKASGSHIMQVYYNLATHTDNIANKYIVVAHVDDEKTTANFQGGEVDMGTQTYHTSLVKVVSKNGNGFDWILGSTQNLGPTYGTKVISSILQSQYRSYAIQTESLRQRMGELRDINRVHGLWGRYNMGSNYTAESDVGVEIVDNYYNAWIGYDQNVLDLKGQNFYGVALSYALVAPEGKDYQGQIHNFGINLYDTFIARNDFYMDFVLKYILTYADYEIDYYSLAKNKPSYFNHKVMLSAEFGKKFKLTDSKSYFFLQPEGQITAGYIFGNTVSFTDASQTTIEANLSGDAPVILRTGLTAGYSLNSNSFKADFYAGTSIFYETSTGGNVELNDGNSTVSYNHKGDFRMSIQGGFDLIFNDNARVYFEAGTSFMGPTQNVYSINAGARFAFGYKNTRKLKVPSSTPPPPPPKTEYDPRNIPVITDNTSEDIRNNNSAKPRVQGYDSDYFINTRKFYRDRTSVTNNPKPTY